MPTTDQTAAKVSVEMNAKGHEAPLGLRPEDRAVLTAAGAGQLTSDSRFVGTQHELRYPSGPDDHAQSARVPMRQHRRLRDRLGLITTSAQVEELPPTRPGQNCGYQLTTMVLTPKGVAVLAALNASGGLTPREVQQ